jgi:hypothetical protein
VRLGPLELNFLPTACTVKPKVKPEKASHAQTVAESLAIRSECGGFNGRRRTIAALEASFGEADSYDPRFP